MITEAYFSETHEVRDTRGLLALFAAQVLFHHFPFAALSVPVVLVLHGVSYVRRHRLDVPGDDFIKVFKLLGRDEV